MATVIRPNAVYLKTSSVAADGFTLLKHHGMGDPASRKLIRGAYARRTCSEDGHLGPTFFARSRRTPLPPVQSLFGDSDVSLLSFDVFRLGFVEAQGTISRYTRSAWDAGASGMSEAGANTKKSSNHERNEALRLCAVSLVSSHRAGENLFLTYGLVNGEYGDD